MTYTKNTWADGEEGGTPITAAKLAHSEQGIEDAHSAILTLAPLTHTHTSSDIIDATALATPLTVVERDASGRFAAVDGVADSDVVTRAQLNGKASTAVQIAAGTGLTGGGDLSTDRTLNVAYGSASGTAVQGDDARVTADQAAGTASIRTLGTGPTQAAAGDHEHTPNFTKVVHGAVAATARPTADYVLWQGSVQPTNWIDGDDWEQV